MAEDWIRYTKSPTGLYRHLETSNIEGDQYEVFIGSIDKKYKNNLHFSSASGFSVGFDINLNSLFHQIMRGEISAEEAVKYIKSQDPANQSSL